MKTYRTFFIVILLASLITACNYPTAGGGSILGPLPGSVSYVLATPDPNATQTPTPFLPEGAVSTIQPQESTAQAAQASPTPTITPTSSALIDRLPRPEGQTNILLLGSDYRPGSGYRTDVILLVILNSSKGTASVVSFPRDTYVLIPGWQMQRINTAMQWGGFDSMKATLEYNFGVTADHYMMTNFYGFKSIIDTLGGVTVNASRAFSDTCDLPWEGSDGYCYISAGPHVMDGASALWYVRARYSTSDFDRLRRAQEVIQAVFLKMLSLNAIARGPELYNLFSNSVETDLTFGDMLPLLPLATKLGDASSVQRYAIVPPLVSGWTTEGGASVQIPDVEAIWEQVIKPAAYE
jgi:LCP family protein required for cell wall assembly